MRRNDRDPRYPPIQSLGQMRPWGPRHPRESTGHGIAESQGCDPRGSLGAIDSSGLPVTFIGQRRRICLTVDAEPARWDGPHASMSLNTDSPTGVRGRAPALKGDRCSFLIAATSGVVL